MGEGSWEEWLIAGVRGSVVSSFIAAHLICKVVTTPYFQIHKQIFFWGSHRLLLELETFPSQIYDTFFLSLNHLFLESKRFSSYFCITSFLNTRDPVLRFTSPSSQICISVLWTLQSTFLKLGSYLTAPSPILLRFPRHSTDAAPRGQMDRQNFSRPRRPHTNPPSATNPPTLTKPPPSCTSVTQPPPSHYPRTTSPVNCIAVPPSS